MAAPKEDRFAEFERHIWDHSSDPFQINYDSPPPLRAVDIKAVALILRHIRASAHGGRPPYSRVADALHPLLQDDQAILERLLQLAGLTRRKIVNDVCPAARRHSLKLPGSWEKVLRDELWRPIAGPYLIRKLWPVLKPLRLRKHRALRADLNALNWATYPGYIRQQRAKEAGHEAERRLAEVLDACGIAFEPSEKLANPRCSDVSVLGHSIDLVVPSAAKPKVCFKSTVHSSPLGEYGKDKVGPAISSAKRAYSLRFGKKRPLVVALIDGEGHFHNKKSLRKVLKISDEFIQFETLWKAVVICRAATGQKKRLELSKVEKDAHLAFLRRHGHLKKVVPPGSLGGAVRAGSVRVER